MDDYLTNASWEGDAPQKSIDLERDLASLMVMMEKGIRRDRLIRVGDLEAFRAQIPCQGTTVTTVAATLMWGTPVVEDRRLAPSEIRFSWRDGPQ